MTIHGFDHHDHSSCVGDALAAAEAHCAAEKLQFTPVRRRVLEILLGEHKAMGAYDILPTLADEGLGKQPPVIYRALDFLVANGFVHKIERLNAYIACAHPGMDHAPAFMICRSCSRVVETESRPAAGLNAAAKDIGFAIEATVIEAEGLCPNCQAPAE
ncbi:MAG: transcriptional repressor [Cognatishimia sp.]|uniref:transcriptional repressor n=1 Tax=Cognatishimia sp. 1_MG-2023 TaxID=3062642 RepID=UPI0026E3DA33|nr:transcriptional repressor [Cognatishimia sp. 1_MG-2023]MDO6727179.1 transcriptional repressor [Cognatishimia sp. 1_MG-2023]